MNKSGLVAIGGAIVGALLVVIYYIVIKPVPLPPLACISGDPHCIVVRVIDVGEKKQIQSIPDERVQGNPTIFWEIETAGYSFPANGIEFPTSKGAPDGEFSGCMVMPQTNAKKFKCKDQGTKGTYGYTVTVSGSSTVPPLDPFIINN